MMSRLDFDIGRDVRYAHSPSTASCLSWEYVSIASSPRRLDVPLAEPDFLPHQPDLYHELAHHLIATPNNPAIEPHQTEPGQLLVRATEHIETEQADNARVTGPQHGVGQALDVLESSSIRTHHQAPARCGSHRGRGLDHQRRAAPGTRPNAAASSTSGSLVHYVE